MQTGCVQEILNGNLEDHQNLLKEEEEMQPSATIQSLFGI